MPSSPIDGLWHCLCPSFKSGLSLDTTFVRFTAPNRKARYAALRRIYTQCAQRTSNAKHTTPCANAVKSPPASLTLYYNQQRYNRLPYIRPELSIQASYEELRRASRKANYQHVQQLVKLLVNQHKERPNQQLYLALILANADPEHGSPSEVEALLQEMVDVDLSPDAAIYHAALKVRIGAGVDVALTDHIEALAIHPDYLLRSEILEELYQRWFSLTPDGWHDVITGLLRDRQLEVALNNFELCGSQGIPIQSWLYDIVSYALCDLNELDEALKLMRYRMSTGERSISPGLWAHLLDAASRSLHHEATLFVWRVRVESGSLNPSSGICVNILNTAVRHGDGHLASDVFRLLDRRKHKFQPHHYEALLESWLASNKLRPALSVLSSMASSSVPLTETSTRAIYTYLVEHYSRLPEAMQTLQSLSSDSDNQIPHAALNCIIEAHIHHSDLASAIETYQVFHSIIPSGPNTATFNVLFRGCSNAHRKDLAMFLASEMLALNVPPNALTYDRLILVCLSESADKVEGFEDAWKYFLEMQSLSWWPRGGTLKSLGIRGCVLADKRVADLVDEERGLSEKRMEYLMWMYWGKEKQSADLSPENSVAQREHERDRQGQDAMAL